MKNLVAAVLSLAAVSAVADTQSTNGFYVGGNVVQVEATGDVDWTAVEVTGGYKLSPYVGGEVRLGGAGDGDPNLTGYGSAYYRVESANDVAKTYLLAGYSFAAVSLDDALPGEDDSIDLQGFSYGVGVGFVINRWINFNVEFRQLLKDNDENIDLRAWSAGIDYRF